MKNYVAHASDRRFSLKLVLVILMILAAGWFLMILRENMRTIRYTIPPGTGRGLAAVDFPEEIILTVGWRDTIVIENQDDQLHLFGPFVVGPQATLTKRFDKPQIVQGNCTFHPSRQMKLAVRPAPWPGWSD